MRAAGKNRSLPAAPAAVLWLTLLLPVLLGACAARQEVMAVVPPIPGEPNMQATAAAQATAIIQQAQATALVLQAQAQASAMIADAGAGEDTQVNGRLEEQINTEAPDNPQTTPEPGKESTPAVLSTEEGSEVEILRVGYAAEGGFIMVSYTAEPDIADTFWPGMLSVTDEESGAVYNEVPVMPKIGPMISRPVALGQVGYILFVNSSPGLKQGSLVTVKLVNYTFEHIKVE